jgi:tyrosyl-tRNA synthetase
MPKIITDEKIIDEVLDRGVEQIFPDREAFKKVLMSGKRIKLYCGFDPTAPALHIGNAIQLNKLRQFQELGHDVIFLIGDFTGMIGDPTDKTTTRRKLTREELLTNSENYKKQASGYLKFDGDNPAEIRYNSEWSDKLTFKDIIELASNFTLQQMINRKMFKRNLIEVKCRHCGHQWRTSIQGSVEDLRSVKGKTTTCPNCGNKTWLDKSDLKELNKSEIKEIDQLRETPIGFHELLYPLAQGYDSVGMDVDLEIGGNDQMFNMLIGRDLMRIIKNKEKFVMTLKLLEDEFGKKMGKSEGNAVFLNQSPNDMYGAIMSWADGLIVPALELATALPVSEIEKIKEALKNPKNNPRDFKMKLAYEMVKINHGKEAAGSAEEYFVRTIQKKETPETVVPIAASIGTAVISVMTAAKMAESNADAKRKIEQGGVKINEEIIKDIKATVTKEMDGKILKVGKREFRKIKIS